jgi:REP element-mobilizing transposase RayT
MIVAGNNLSRTLQSLKRFTAQKIINLAEKQGKVWLLNQFTFYKKGYKTQSKNQLWQEGFHPELIINDKMLIQKIDYIHYNPVKRGYVDKPEFWKYSSARNYIFNDHSLIKLEMLPMLIT